MTYEIPYRIFSKPKLQMRGKVNQQRPTVVIGLSSFAAKEGLILCQFLKSIKNTPALFVGGSSNYSEMIEIKKIAEKILGWKRCLILRPATSTLGNGKSLAEGVANLPAWVDEILRAKTAIVEKIAKDRSVALIDIKSTGATDGIIGEALFRNVRDNFTYTVSALMEAPAAAELCLRNQPEILSNMAKTASKKHLNFFISNSAKSAKIDIGAMCVLGSAITHTFGEEDYELSDLYNWLGGATFWNVQVDTINNPLDWCFRPFPIPARLPNVETTIFQGCKLCAKMQFTPQDRAVVVGARSDFKKRIEDETLVKSGGKPKLQMAPAKIKDETMNIVAGKLSPMSVENIETPHFDKAREIV